MFIRFTCFWPKGYQRGSLGKSHQNGVYLKQAMRKSCPPSGFEPAAFGLPVISGPLPVISGPIIQKLQVRILWEDNFFYCLF